MVRFNSYQSLLWKPNGSYRYMILKDFMVQLQKKEKYVPSPQMREIHYKIHALNLVNWNMCSWLSWRIDQTKLWWMLQPWWFYAMRFYYIEFVNDSLFFWWVSVSQETSKLKIEVDWWSCQDFNETNICCWWCWSIFRYTENINYYTTPKQAAFALKSNSKSVIVMQLLKKKPLQKKGMNAIPRLRFKWNQ